MPFDTKIARTALCLAAALSATACSTKPRNFSATVRPISALAMNQGEGGAYATCDQLVRKGHKSNFASAAATGGAAGAALFGSAVAVAGSGTVGLGGVTGAGYALSAAIPFVGFAAGFGVNRMIRSGREKNYRKHMATCLEELGYQVVDWTRMKKKQPGTATLAAPRPESALVPAPAPDVANGPAAPAIEASPTAG